MGTCSHQVKIAILGPRGFLGRSLSKILLAQGHEITGYVLTTDSLKFDGIDYRHVNDLYTPRVISEAPYDVVINLAARRSTKFQSFSESQVNNFTFEIPKLFF